MKKTFTLALTAALLLAVTGAAHADSQYKAVVRASNGKPVRTMDGGCVQTMWSSETNECGDRGCKKPVAAAPVAAISLEERTVYFAFGKSALSRDARHKLDTLAATLKAQPRVKSVRIAGFADRIGSAVSNEKLSKKRAEAVRKYLVSRGVVNVQLTETRWFGSSAPTTTCSVKMPHKKLVQCLQQDRRVEVEVEYEAPAATE